MKQGQISKLLSKYILINTLVIFLPIMLLGFFIVRQQSEKDISQYMDNENVSLIQTKNEVENVMSSICKAAQQISIDKEMTVYQLQKNDFNTVTALKKLEYYRSSVGAVRDLILCLDGAEKVYTTIGIKDFETFCRISYQLEGTLDEARLHEVLDGKQVFGFLKPTEYLSVTGKHFTVITYPLAKVSQQSYGTLVGILDKEFFEQCLIETGIHSETLICNISGEVLYSSEEELDIVSNEVLLLLQDYTTDTVNYDMELEGHDYRAIIHYSQLTNLYYIRLVDQRDLQAALKSTQMPLLAALVVLGLLLVLVAGIMLALYNYLPIRNLYRLFSANLDYKEKKNELLLLNDYICDLQEQNSSIVQKLEQRELIRLRELLMDILSGILPCFEDDSSLLIRQGYIEKENKFSIVTLTDRQDGLHDETAILQSRLYHLSTEELFFITQEPEDCFVMMYSAAVGEASVEKAVEQLCEMLKKEGFSLRAGIGCYTDCFAGLRESLNESILALGIDSERPIVLFHELQYENADDPFWHPKRHELLLHLAIRKGDQPEILKNAEILENELSDLVHYYHNHETRYILYRIMNYLSDYPGVSEGLLREAMEKMVGYSNVHDFFAKFRNYIACASCEARKNAGDAKGSRIEEILSFIDENYCRPEMSLAYVADHFEMRDYNFSKLFKEKSGINFIDYLSDLRLEQGKKLLNESKMTLQQIVDSIGYTDVPSFSRKFSKRYGITPGVYRKAAKQKQE